MMRNHKLWRLKEENKKKEALSGKVTLAQEDLRGDSEVVVLEPR